MRQQAIAPLNDAEKGRLSAALKVLLLQCDKGSLGSALTDGLLHADGRKARPSRELPAQEGKKRPARAGRRAGLAPEPNDMDSVRAAGEQAIAAAPAGLLSNAAFMPTQRPSPPSWDSKLLNRCLP